MRSRNRPQKISETLDPGAEMELDIKDLVELDADSNFEFNNAKVSQGNRSLSADHMKGSVEKRRIDVDGTVEYRDPRAGGARQERQLRWHRSRVRRRAVRTAHATGARRRQPPVSGQQRRREGRGRAVHHLPRRRSRLADPGRQRVPSIPRRAPPPARDARVEFLGVPIMRLPYITFPVGNVRKSGFLFPSFGTSTRGGRAAVGALVLEHRTPAGPDLHAHLVHLARRRPGSRLSLPHAAQPRRTGGQHPAGRRQDRRDTQPLPHHQHHQPAGRLAPVAGR